MRYAAVISGYAHIELMKKIKPLQSERELHALFEYECAKFGAHHQAYNPIVAGGQRGAILHYGKNDQVLPDDKNQLFLIDAGF